MKASVQPIEYITGSVSLLDRVEKLWKELNDHHVSVSTHFSQAFSNFAFDARKASLTGNSKESDLLVEIAADTQLNTDIGYCISSVIRENKGEIESIYVKPGYRGCDIGHTLMTRAITWLDSKNVTEQEVAVAYGNEQVFEFYARFGFLPRVTVLKKTPD